MIQSRIWNAMQFEMQYNLKCDAIWNTMQFEMQCNLKFISMQFEIIGNAICNSIWMQFASMQFAIEIELELL